MTNRTLSIILLVLLAFAAGFGQTSYKGVTPGQSTRVDLERVLGRPVKEHSATLIEYRTQPLTGKIFVQYRQGSLVVERIEMLCRLESSSCDDLIQSLNLPLPESADSDNLDDQNWKSLYGPPLFIRTLGAMADVTAKSTPASRLSLYSRELYEGDFERAREATEASLIKSGSTTVSGGLLNRKAIVNPEPVYPAIAKAAGASGTVRVQVTADEDGRVLERSAVSGHPLLREAAREAARHARLKPTLLSGKPVKVTGTLIYNFKLE